MVDINNYFSQIEEFIQNSVEKFITENGNPNSIGVYCCPWAGWLTTNFNLVKTINETQNNCPDFEFVEYDFLDLPGWQEEYENNNPEFEINGKVIDYNHDLGDERLNEQIFGCLKPIVHRLKDRNNAVFLLQMLDSSCVETI